MKEGSQIEISPYALYATDRDTDETHIELQIVEAPKFGHIAMVNNPIKSHTFIDESEEDGIVTNAKNSIKKFTMKNIRDGKIVYVNSVHQDGVEPIEDLFTIQAFDGHYYSADIVQMKVIIQPTNDELPQIRLLGYFSVSLGMSKVLTPYLFSVRDLDVPNDLLQIRFTEVPKYGSLLAYWQHGEKYIITAQSNPITQSYLNMLNLVYMQNSTSLSSTNETSSSNLYSQDQNPFILAIDQFTVSVSDGLNTVKKQARIFIRPTNNQAPEMYVKPNPNDGIQMEGVRWARIDQQPGGLIIKDADSSDDDLILTLNKEPRYGVIQRLPRLPNPYHVEIMDLIEDAWDKELINAKNNALLINELVMGGSVGGPKTNKILKRGESFSKRQIENGRIQ